MFSTAKGATRSLPTWSMIERWGWCKGKKKHDNVRAYNLVILLSFYAQNLLGCSWWCRKLVHIHRTNDNWETDSEKLDRGMSETTATCRKGPWTDWCVYCKQIQNNSTRRRWPTRQPESWREHQLHCKVQRTLISVVSNIWNFNGNPTINVWNFSRFTSWNSTKYSNKSTPYQYPLVPILH